MVDLFIRFKSFSNLWFFIIMSAAFCLWIYLRLKNKSYFSLTPFILTGLFVFISWGGIVGIHHDEAEHLHCAWMVSQGMIPFKDFWQHHTPLVWLILAPAYKFISPSASIFIMSRIICALIFAVIVFLGWKVAGKAWQGKAGFQTFALILFSSSVLGEFLWIRPDLFMYLFLLLGLYFSFEITGDRLVFSFLTGASFGLAASFTFKQYLLLLLPVVIIFLGRDKRVAAKFLLYLAGLAAGILPLLFYLIKRNIVREFSSWVLGFNLENITAGAVIPVAVGFMGAWGAYRLFRRYRALKDTNALQISIAFCLSTLSLLTGTPGRYYLGFWLILCAIAGSGCSIMEISGKASSRLKKSLILGCFLSLLVAPNIIHARTHINAYLKDDLKTVSEMIRYCRGGDTCMLVLPLHPIFAHDATRLYSYWQYDFVYDSPPIKSDIGSKNIVETIISSPPAIIQYSYNKRVFILDLFQKKLISSEDYWKLTVFLEGHYSVRRLGLSKYFVRNDKLAQ